MNEPSPRPGTTDALVARVELRPLATPLPLGFLALGVATLGYAALVLELERGESWTVLPLGRTGRGRRALEGQRHHQVGRVGSEPGVREQL
ncbi:MAG TPA: hypothetical protein VD864_18655 [Nocardioides sp.]|nr:hypothetical protein [Nocardioides sp.]